MIEKIGDVFQAIQDLGLGRAIEGLGLFFADIKSDTGYTSRLLVSYGFSDAELRNGEYQKRIHPDDRTAYLEAWRRMIEGKEDELFCEYRVRDGEGCWRWVETHAVVMERGSDGSLNTIVGMDRAIDARRHAMETLETRYRDARRKLDITEKLTGSDAVFRTDRGLIESLTEAVTQFSGILAFDRISLFVTRSGSTATRSAQWHRLWTSDAGAPVEDRHLSEALSAVEGEHHPLIIDGRSECGHYHSMVAVPIRLDGVLIAVMSIESLKYEAYRSEDLNLIEAFARIVAIVLGNQRFIERKISHLKKDALTGFFTRASLEHDAQRLWEEYCKLYSRNAVAMIDIDHFKRINDIYGHQTGDLVIRRIADVILRSIRREDIIIRYGGEEFLVILPNADHTAARQIMDRLRIECEALDMCECTETVTVSVGVAPAAGPKVQPLDTQIAAADSALYESKRSGRNRVTVRAASDVEHIR